MRRGQNGGSSWRPKWKLWGNQNERIRGCAEEDCRSHGRPRLRARSFACDRPRGIEGASLVRCGGSGHRCPRQGLRITERCRACLPDHPRNLRRRWPAPEEHGVTTPPWEVIHPGQRPTFPLPIVVKAPRQGSTVGVVIVKSEDEIDSAIGEAAKYGRELLIEKFVSGRELTIGILGDQALPILEIIPKGGFYDFNNKYPFLNPQAGGGAEHVCPAKIDPAKTKQIQEQALNAFRSLGLVVYGRVDILLSDSGDTFVLEVNNIPG